MKAHGSGSVTPRADGRFWARAPDVKRTSLGLYPTAAEAEEAIRGWALARAAAGLSPKGDTFADFGAKIMIARELDGLRGVRQEKSRWNYHLLRSSLATKRVSDITAGDVKTFVREIGRKKVPGTQKKLSRETVCRCLSLASVIFDEAVTAPVPLRSDNPAARVKVKGEPRTEEPWDYLRLEEQRAIWSCEGVPLWGRLMMAFAWGCGLRQGEQWNLELRDLHLEGEDPHVIVRFGSRGQAPKNGRIRRVELFGIGLEAARRWVEFLPGYARANPHKLVFPTSRGNRREVGAPKRGMTNAEMEAAGVTKRKEFKVLPGWLRAAGVTRKIRWHDLRHTCASSLVAGWWGRTWTLQEVCGMLGHSSIVVTQRYAHLGVTSLMKAARETQAHGHVGADRGRDRHVVSDSGVSGPHVPVAELPGGPRAGALAQEGRGGDRSPVPASGHASAHAGEPGASGLALAGYDLGTALKIPDGLPAEIMNVINSLIALHKPNVSRG